VFISFVFKLKAILQILKFEFCKINWGRTTDKLAINLRKFAQDRFQLMLAFRIWPLEIYYRIIKIQTKICIV